SPGPGQRFPARTSNTDSGETLTSLLCIFSAQHRHTQQHVSLVKHTQHNM
ncbi:unnamed protein product, partial [Staurois parvus]